MNKFKVVFLDGKEMKVTALNFSVACVLAKYKRIGNGYASHRELMIDEKKSSIIKTKRGHA